MKSFFTVFLKVIMVASFVAVIAFVALVLINNVNVAYDAYSNIAVSQRTTPYDNFAQLLQKNVRKIDLSGDNITFTVDDRVQFTSDAMLVLNANIDFYVDYLAIEKDLSKKEQIALSKAYSKYKDEFQYATSCYNDYMDLLISIVHDDGFEHYWSGDDVTKATFLSSKEVTLRLAYKDCYIEGSNFLRTLLGYVKGRALSNSLTFGKAMGITKVAYGNSAMEELFDNPNLSVQDSPQANAFYKAKAYGSGSDDFNDGYMLVNNQVMSFSSFASQLDMFSLVCDYEHYIDSLTPSYREKAVFCHDFLLLYVVGE